MKSVFFQKENDCDIGYVVFLPENYEKGKKYPMILVLHGAGERGNGKDELKNALSIGIGRYISDGKLDIEAIVLCPQCPKERVWNQFVFDIKRLTDKVANEYGADEKRISVTGMSMGGFGTWEMGLTFPDSFSALAPICGGGMAWRTGALKGKPIWAFHGDADTVVDISNSYEMVKKSKEAGAEIKYTVFEGVAHNAWDPAYLTTDVINWLIRKER